mgnify:CR=1 FL=1|jgi:polyvinyl alcohol dehydrogenase (cytochrome)
MVWRRTLVSVGLCALLAGCSDGGGTRESASSTGTRTGTGRPAAAWTTFGAGPDNARRAAGERVGAAEAPAPRWHRDLGVGMSSTPMVDGDEVVFADWGGTIHSADSSTGEDRWTFELGGAVMSSPALTDDAVLVANGSTLVCLDRATGTERWRAEISDHPIAITPASPVVADGLVVIGTASGELMVPVDDYTFRGSLAAFDLATGAPAWRRWFTSGDAAEGNGVGIWSTPSFDPERGLLFVGTGNTYEPPAAPMSDSLVALDAATGEVRWHRQFTYPDVWSTAHAGGLDADVGAGPNLWTADGRDLVGAGDKAGSYHALDRSTGDVVWETKLTPGSVLGGVIGTAALSGDSIVVASNVGGDANAPGSTSRVVSLDRGDGTIRWAADLDSTVFAPVTVTDDVALVGTVGGSFVALRLDDGSEAWRIAAPDQVGSGASVVDGVIYWGYGYALFSRGDPAGGVFAFGARSFGAGSAGAGSAGATGASGGGGATDDAHDHPESASAGDRGAELYTRHCSACHGATGQGGVGPELRTIAERVDEERHLEIVHRGTGTQMPAFGEALTDDEIAAIVDFERHRLAR